jgi:hypothetical protein
MILFNWLQCVDGKFNYARLNATDNDNITDADVLAWEKIYDSYINHFGINKLYQQYLDKCRKRAIAQNDYILTNKKIYFNVIRIMDVEIEKIKNEMNKGISTDQVLVHLTKFMGFRQDIKKITVIEYFNMIKEYERAN